MFNKVFNALKKFASSPRVQMFVMLLVAGTVSMFAQSITAGTTALENVAQGVQAYIPVVTKVCYALAGVVAIVGAVSVYIAMNNDDQDVKKKIIVTVGACIFLIAAATALPKFFGYENSATGGSGTSSNTIEMSAPQTDYLNIIELAA